MALQKTTIGITYFATLVSLILYLVLVFTTAFSPWWVYGALVVTLIFQVLATINQFKRREWIVIPSVIISIILTVLLLLNYNFESIFF